MPVRPKSIVQFDYIYLAIIALGLVNTALLWDEMMASVDVQRMNAQLGMAPIFGTILLVTALQLLLWYFTARRGTIVGKWIFVIYMGITLLYSAYALTMYGAANAIAGVISVALLILQGIAIWLLFRPDTPAWFGEDVDDTTAA